MLNALQSIEALQERQSELDTALKSLQESEDPKDFSLRTSIWNNSVVLAYAYGRGLKELYIHKKIREKLDKIIQTLEAGAVCIEGNLQTREKSDVRFSTLHTILEATQERVKDLQELLGHSCEEDKK